MAQLSEQDKPRMKVGGPKRKVFTDSALPSNLLTGEKVAWSVDLQRKDLKYGKCSEEEDAIIMGAMREYSAVRTKIILPFCISYSCTLYHISTLCISSTYLILSI